MNYLIFVPFTDSMRSYSPSHFSEANKESLDDHGHVSTIGHTGDEPENLSVSSFSDHSTMVQPMTSPFRRGDGSRERPGDRATPTSIAERKHFSETASEQDESLGF